MSPPASDVEGGVRTLGRVPSGSIELPDLAQLGTYEITHCQSASKKPAGAERTASGRAWTAPAARTSRPRASTTERIVRCIGSLLSRGPRTRPPWPEGTAPGEEEWHFLRGGRTGFREPARLIGGAGGL